MLPCLTLSLNMILIGPIRSLRHMPFVGSPTSRLNGWSAPTNSETRDCLRSRPIRCSISSETTQDTTHFSRKCTCRHTSGRCTRHGYLPSSREMITFATNVGVDRVVGPAKLWNRRRIGGYQCFLARAWRDSAQLENL